MNNWITPPPDTSSAAHLCATAATAPAPFQPKIPIEEEEEPDMRPSGGKTQDLFKQINDILYNCAPFHCRVTRRRLFSMIIRYYKWTTVAQQVSSSLFYPCMILNRAGFRVMYPLWNQFWGWILLTFGSRATSALNPLNQHHVTILTPFRIRLALQRCHFGSASSRYAQTSGPLGVHWPKAPGISWDYPDTLREHREHPRPKKKAHATLAAVVRVSLKLQLIVLIFPLDFDKRPALKKVLPVALVPLKRAICSGQTYCFQGEKRMCRQNPSRRIRVADPLLLWTSIISNHHWYVIFKIFRVCSTCFHTVFMV